MKRQDTLTMRKVMLDHHQAPGLLPAGMAWLAAGIACALLVVYLFNHVHGQMQALQADRDLLQRQGQPTPVKQAPQVQARLQAELKAVDGAQTDLAQPWDALFGMLETLAGPQVRIMQIEPNAGKHRLRLSAQATDAASMLAYIQALSQQPVLREVFLLTHEHAEDGRSMPYSFVVEATWLN